MKRGIHWRLMTAFAAFTLGVTLLFGLFAMAFVYTVEDRFLEQLLNAHCRETPRLQHERRTTRNADGVHGLSDTYARP